MGYGGEGSILVLLIPARRTRPEEIIQDELRVRRAAQAQRDFVESVLAATGPLPATAPKKKTRPGAIPRTAELPRVADILERR